jgi:hypothetical protein
MIAGSLLFLVGCSDSQSSGDEDGSTPAAETAPALTSRNLASELAAAQADVGSAHVEATLEAAGQNGTMSGDVDGLGNLDEGAIDMALELGGQKIQLILVDGVLYVEGLGLNSSPAKPWLKLDVSNPNNPLSQFLALANPANFTAYFEGVTRVKDLGAETVDGVQAQHYAVTVDTAKMIAANPAFKGQDVSSLGLPTALTSDVYVDSDNLPIEISVAMDGVANFEAHFSSYGEPVDISAPPANQVSDFSL